MATRSIESMDGACRGIHSATRWRAHAHQHPLRHRLAVVGPDAADIVRHAGGWLFDRAAAGWEVTALVTATDNAASLQILGATVLDLRQSLAISRHDLWPTAVAVSVRSYLAEREVREGVLDCLDRGLAEVAIWGEDLPAELAERVATSCHRVSVAAMAFKSCALAAAGFPGVSVPPVEPFRSGSLLPPAFREEMRDLVPLG
ncbi:hypothetical protein AB0I35_16375 [Nocardia sp. NPDC050378]|uniref:hypothetical protein n=1 Tax=Nocardia sp. NPDC050378 TaxID=3155400 RepID=UPI0033FE9A90